MATEVLAIDPEGGRARPARPYAPSWANVVATWMERLPGPTWAAYAVAMALSIGLYVAQTGIESIEMTGGTLALVYDAILPFGVLGLIHVLDRTAGRALHTLGPQLGADASRLGTLRYELTVAPAMPALALTLFAFIVTPLGFVMDPAGSGVEGHPLMAVAFRFLWESLIKAVFFILVYHTLRQLRAIDAIHGCLTQIDVFDQGPLYAFSQVTSRTALGLIALLAPSILLIPAAADATYLALSGAWYFLVIVVAAAAFFLPLRGVHDRLVAEKRRLHSEIGQRLTSTMDSIHAAVDAGDRDAVESGNRALSTLILERDLVNRVATWPWSTGALTGFLSAVLLPLVLFLAQRFLGDALGS